MTNNNESISHKINYNCDAILSLTLNLEVFISLQKSSEQAQRASKSFSTIAEYETPQQRLT